MGFQPRRKRLRYSAPVMLNPRARPLQNTLAIPARGGRIGHG
jgi:hypothetical protein